MKFLFVIFPIFLMIAGIAAMVAVVLGIKFILRRQKIRSPFTEKILRSPGGSILKKINEEQDDFLFYGIMIMMAPVLIYSIHVSQSYFGGVKENIFRTMFFIFQNVLVIAAFSFLLVKKIKIIKKLRLGYYGELATGQYLQQLVRGGYHVFHDFPAENFNIDHVAVGPGGIFAIETKARSKPLLKNGHGRDEAKVIYDGKMLKFPTWTETEPLAQAERQAKWLADFLTKAVGEPVKVQPVLALPGWFVNRTTQQGMLVVNPKSLSSLLKSRLLSEKMITAVAHQLEQRCRDIDPSGK